MRDARRRDDDERARDRCPCSAPHVRCTLLKCLHARTIFGEVICPSVSWGNAARAPAQSSDELVWPSVRLASQTVARRTLGPTEGALAYSPRRTHHVRRSRRQQGNRAISSTLDTRSLPKTRRNRAQWFRVADVARRLRNGDEQLRNTCERACAQQVIHRRTTRNNARQSRPLTHKRNNGHDDRRKRVLAPSSRYDGRSAISAPIL